MKGIKLEKRSLCDTTKAIRVATKLSVLKKECSIDSVRSVLKSIDELDSYFLGDDESKCKIMYSFFHKNDFCVIYSVNEVERCIYINQNGYVIFSANKSHNFNVNIESGLIKLNSNVFARHPRERLTVKVSNYLDVIVK